MYRKGKGRSNTDPFQVYYIRKRAEKQYPKKKDVRQLRSRIPVKLFEFCMLADWQENLNALESMVLPENWKFSLEKPEARNKSNPILANYVSHTFSKLANDFNNSEQVEDQQKYIFLSGKECVFNTGLFDKNYKPVFAHIVKTRPGSQTEWIFNSFVQENSVELKDISYLPQRARYFRNISDLVYNTDYNLRINIDHILDDESNMARLPDVMKSWTRHMQSIAFEGAVEHAKRRVEANYKAAVPQYYKNKIQLLLPLYLLSRDKVDLALAVTPMDGYYTGFTCLTIDMAYNNARLIARPDSDWLTP